MCLRKENRAAATTRLRLFTGIFLLMLLAPAVLLAASDMSARYIQSQGSDLMIEITTASSPPASAILIQKLPSGVKIISARPGYSNYKTKKNRAKWLLRNLKPGISTVSITLDRPVTQADISAEIRFKPASGGKTVTRQVSK